MLAVISDTSPIRALVHLGHLDLLRDLYGDVWLPAAVDRELRNPRPRFPIIDVSQVPFLHVVTPKDQSQVQHFRRTLHGGEAEALALALELGAPVVLMDDLPGRAAARQAGLRPIGTLGILLEAKRHRLVPLVGPLMDRLINEINFFVAPSLRAVTLRLAGELP